VCAGASESNAASTADAATASAVEAAAYQSWCHAGTEVADAILALNMFSRLWQGVRFGVADNRDEWSMSIFDVYRHEYIGSLY